MESTLHDLKTRRSCRSYTDEIPSKEILDNTGVHPESYEAAKKLLERYGYTDEDVEGGNLVLLSERIKQEGKSKVCQQLGIGEPTLDDIIKEAYIK